MPACDRQGPAERTGEQIDKATEKAGDKLEEAGNTVMEENDTDHLLDRDRVASRLLKI